MCNRNRLIPKRFSVLLLMSAALTMGIQEGWAQDHHLFVSDVWATPDPLVCPSTVSATVAAVGEKDYLLNSGDAAIRVSYQLNGGAWTEIGEIPITWSGGDGVLVKWKEWPLNFPSQPDNTIEFRPTTPGTYRFKAETVYPPTITGMPSERFSKEYTVSDTCPVPPCTLLPVKFGGGGATWRVLCPGDWNICDNFPGLCPIDVCKRFPRLCPDPCKLDPRLCREPCKLIPGFPGCGGGVIDPCQFGLSCPDPPFDPFPVDVLFDNRVNKFNLAVIDSKGEIVAETEQLTRPMKIGSATYNQRLRYTAAPGEKYLIIYWPGKGTKRDEGLPFPLLIRPRLDKRR